MKNEIPSGKANFTISNWLEKRKFIFSTTKL